MPDTTDYARQVLDKFEHDDDTTEFGKLRGVARLAAESYRDGTGALDPKVVWKLEPLGAVVLCLEFAKIIGKTTYDERWGWPEQVDRFGFPPQFCPPGSPPPTAEEHANAKRCLVYAAEWLEYHARSPIEAIEYGLGDLAEWLPGRTSLTVGLSWVAATKLPPS